MGISITWDDDARTAIYVKRTGEWTEEEGLRAIDEIARMMASVDHPVYGINDFRDSEISTSINGFKFMRQMRGRIPMGDNFMVMVGVPAVVSRAMDIANRIYRFRPENVSYAQTPEEARQLIAQHKQAVANPT